MQFDPLNASPPEDEPELPAVVLTYLAPAAQCNQRCPRCILELGSNPVRDFSLSPDDFRQFAARFLEVGVPVRTITFQGFEVTLPRSWPYLIPVFRASEVGARSA